MATPNKAIKISQKHLLGIQDLSIADINLNIEFRSFSNFLAFLSSRDILDNFDMCFTVLRSIVI